MNNKIIQFNGTAALQVFQESEQKLAVIRRTDFGGLTPAQTVDLLLRTYEHADVLDLEEHGKKTPMHVPRSSDLYPLCRRRLFHSIVDWKKRPSHSIKTRRAFRGGKRAHKAARVDLLRILGPEGWTLDRLKTEIPHDIMYRNRLVMTHTPDTVLRDPVEKNEILAEIKSTNTFTVQKLQTFEDIQRHPWFRRYVLQVYLNAWSLGLEYGVFFLTDNRGTHRLIPFSIDTEQALQQIQDVLDTCYDVVIAVEAHHQGKTMGRPQDARSQAECQQCWLRQIDMCPGVAPADQEFPVETDADVIGTLDYLKDNRVVGEQYRKALDATKRHFADTYRDSPAEHVITPVCPVRLKRSTKIEYAYPDKVTAQLDEWKKEFKRMIPGGRLEVIPEFPEDTNGAE